MNIYASLPQTLLPQMTNDGYITAVELEHDGGVIAEVSHYSNAAHGDYLGLYWDGVLMATYLVVDPDTDPWPWATTIPADNAPDGPHQVWYTVTDAAQNPSASPITLAIVDRNHTDGLPAPSFPDADANNTITYSSVAQHNGTHILVPWSANAYAAGDTVYVYWRELEEQGEQGEQDNTVPGSPTHVLYTVTAADVDHDFAVLIDPSYITAIASSTSSIGSAEAWYSVIPNDGAAQSSQTGSVLVDMSSTSFYPAPLLPAGNDGWIDCSEITASGIEIDVPGNDSFQSGGVVSVYWQGYGSDGAAIPEASYSFPHTLTLNEVTAGFSMMIPADRIMPIGVGTAQAWYSVAAPSVPGSSALTGVQVDAVHCTSLTPPVFPAAVGDNIITDAEIETDSGTEMDVSYSGMTAGDMVTAYWFGYLTTPDSPVSGTPWTESRTLTSQEESEQRAVFHVPADRITPAENGYGRGHYQVIYNESSGFASSDNTDVTLAPEATSGLYMNCATGAPIFDPNVLVRPMNSVMVSGPAGAEIVLSLPVGSDAWFNPNGTQTLSVNLDTMGQAYAQVYCMTPGNVLVSAYVPDNPTLSASGSMTFTPWLTGAGELQYYGYSTRAEANGTDICSVYLQTQESSLAQEARLVLGAESNALIPSSGTQVAIIDVSSSHAGEFHITDSLAEMVPFTLSLLNTSNAYVTNTLTFTASETHGFIL